eukprot:scaffold51643_cov63-Phaeocystis_antarctica.AAC.1
MGPHLSCLRWFFSEKLPHSAAPPSGAFVEFFASIGSLSLSLNAARAQECTQVRFSYPPAPMG